MQYGSECCHDSEDGNFPKNAWRMARVEEVFPSDDGLVRKVKLPIPTCSLDKQGQRTNKVHYLE